MSNTLEVPPLPVAKRDEPKPMDMALEAIPEPQVTDEEALAAFERAGLVMIHKATVTDLASVGVYVKGVGVLKIQRGRVMVTQQRLDEAMRIGSQQLEKIFKDEKHESQTSDIVKLMTAIGYVGSRLTDAQRLAAEIESMTVVSGSPVTDSPVPNQSFQPKQKIQPLGPTIHNHGPTQVLVQGQSVK